MCLFHLGSIPFLCPSCMCFWGIGIISECHNVQDSLGLPNLPGLIVLILHLSSLLVTLNCWTSPIYLYFRSRFLTSQVKRK